jgi:hypothetical protein
MHDSVGFLCFKCGIVCWTIVPGDRQSLICSDKTISPLIGSRFPGDSEGSVSETFELLPMSVRCAQLLAALLRPFVILGLVAASLSALLLIRLIR